MHSNDGQIEVLTTWVASRGVDATLAAAIEVGLSGVRIIAKGVPGLLCEQVSELRREARRLNPTFKVVVDLPGGKPRLGPFREPVKKLRGETIRLALGVASATGGALPTAYLADHWEAIEAGHRILLNDGQATITVLSVSATEVVAVVADDAVVFSPNRSLNLPDSNAHYCALSNADVASLAELRGVALDGLAISMVSDCEDVRAARLAMKEAGIVECDLIAKIETARAMDSLDRLSELADTLMIARGDLTVEYGLPRLPSAQVQVVEAALSNDKSVIAATGIFASMVAPGATPTIAEVSDAGSLMLLGVRRFLLSDAVGLERPADATVWLRQIYRQIDHAVLLEGPCHTK